MNKKREKALEGLTRIAQVIISDKYHDESIEVLLCSKAIERIVILKGQYLPKTHKDTVLSMSISDDDDNDGSDFIRLHPVVEENKNEVGGNDDDIKNREEEGKKKKSDEEEKAKAGEEGRSLEEELPINERIIKFSNSLDKNDDSLWNINGSPKIKNFKEHFGDEFNLKSSELIGLLEFSGLEKLLDSFTE